MKRLMPCDLSSNRIWTVRCNDHIELTLLQHRQQIASIVACHLELQSGMRLRQGGQNRWQQEGRVVIRRTDSDQPFRLRALKMRQGSVVCEQDAVCIDQQCFTGLCDRHGLTVSLKEELLHDGFKPFDLKADR